MANKVQKLLFFSLLFAGATTACAWCGSTDSRTGSEGMWQSITTAQNLILEER